MKSRKESKPASKTPYFFDKVPVAALLIFTGIILAQVYDIENIFLLTCRFADSSFDLPIKGGLMKYMLLIYFNEQVLSETERQACYVESTQLAHEIKASGQYLAANPLHPTAMATTVRAVSSNEANGTSEFTPLGG